MVCFLFVCFFWLSIELLVTLYVIISSVLYFWSCESSTVGNKGIFKNFEIGIFWNWVPPKFFAVFFSEFTGETTSKLKCSSYEISCLSFRFCCQLVQGNYLNGIKDHLRSRFDILWIKNKLDTTEVLYFYYYQHIMMHVWIYLCGNIFVEII